MIRIMIGFVVGVAVGAAAALLMAPSSGEDLRQTMHDRAEADMQRTRAEYRRSMDDLHARMDKMSKDLDETGEIDEDVDQVVDAEPDTA